MKAARHAIALHSTAECLGWLAHALGIFADHGLDIDVDLEVSKTTGAGPRVAAGIVARDWDFADVGAGPIVEANLKGEDAVILLAAEPPGALFMTARAGIEAPEQLEGRTIGVLSQGGQTELSAKALLREWGLLESVTFDYLGTFARIYDALGAGAIDACVMTADYRFRAARALGATMLADVGERFRFQGPIVTTTRALISADRALVRAFVAACVETITVFKTDRDRILPHLRAYLAFPEPGVIEDIYDHYAAAFEARPYPSIEGVAMLIEEYRETYPEAAARLRPEDCIDASLLDEVLGP